MVRAFIVAFFAIGSMALPVFIIGAPDAAEQRAQGTLQTDGGLPALPDMAPHAEGVTPAGATARR